MNKLMIALAAVAMTIGAQAAAVSWTTDALYAPDATGAFTGTTLKKDTSTAYTLLVTMTFFDAEGKELKGLGNTTASTLNKSSKATATTTGYEFLVDTDYQYAAHYALTYGGKEYTMDVGPTTFTQTKATGDFSLTVPTAGKWSAVPEPTSGLLLLLGVAGLALRRRRA